MQYYYHNLRFLRLSKNVQRCYYPKNIVFAKCRTPVALRINECIKTWGKSFNKTLEEYDLFFGYLTLFF
jgi:hypothetical protein